MTIRRLKVAFAALMLFGLSACGGLKEGSLFERDFWTGGPLFNADDQAAMGLAALAKGEYVTAETHFDKALLKDPKNVHALLGAAMVYQNTFRVTKARQTYEAVLALRPVPTKQLLVWNDLNPRPIAEIASANLALLDSAGVTRDLGRDPGTMANPNAPGMSTASGTPALGPSAAGQATPPAGSPPVPGRTQGTVTAAPTGSAMLGRPAPAQMTSVAPGDPQMPRFADADANIVARFKAINALLEQGLLTQDEHAGRRRANIGALLPLTSPPPAAGIDRPVPSIEQISGRLRAIGRALELRAMNVAQHSSERAMILDALMPAAPVQVANPAPPPQGLMEAADGVRRLEMLKSTNLITSDEYARERAAIEASMQPKPAPGAPARVEQEKMAEAKPIGPQPAVHLASYRSQQAADRGWAQLRRAHSKLLEGLDPEITRVDLGPGKGIYWRLKAGPLKTPQQAQDVCRQLKAARQFCEPAVTGAG